MPDILIFVVDVCVVGLDVFSVDIVDDVDVGVGGGSSVRQKLRSASVVWCTVLF